MIIFELERIFCADEITVERPCHVDSVGLYTTLELATTAMCNVVTDDLEGEWQHNFGYLIRERAVDADHPYRGFLSLRTYNSKGELNDEFLDDYEGYDTFHGRDPLTLRHKVGDIVWCLAYDCLELCIVGWLPPTKEWYDKRHKICSLAWYTLFPVPNEHSISFLCPTALAVAACLSGLGGSFGGLPSGLQ